MDLESLTLTALLGTNFIIITALVIYMVFFYRWDTKVYDDLAENVGMR